MITDERIRDYLYSLESDQDELCGRIAREARRDHHVPQNWSQR